jgi:hypothetical protein
MMKLRSNCSMSTPVTLMPYHKTSYIAYKSKEQVYRISKRYMMQCHSCCKQLEVVSLQFRNSLLLIHIKLLNIPQLAS